jgi:hypothetical protein
MRPERRPAAGMVGRFASPHTPTMPQGQTRDEVVESWMLTVVADGGVDRFDDLHVDDIDEQWKDRKVWVSAGLEAYRIAVALRSRHRLPFVVALGFSLESAEGSNPMGFKTIEDFATRLDWSPPSLYLFHPGRTPCTDAQRAVVENVVEENVFIQDLNPAIFGVEVCAERVYYMAFRPAGSNEANASVFVEG